MGGEGNVVLDQGLQGAAEAELEYSASKEMFETYDKINIVSDYVDDYDPQKVSRHWQVSLLQILILMQSYNTGLCFSSSKCIQ